MEDALQGLKQSPPSLPSKYFYDEVGSRLFDQICDLDEYYLTRMLLPSGVCASLSMVAWNVEHHAFGERAGILVTLFLALVASTTSYAEAASRPRPPISARACPSRHAPAHERARPSRTRPLITARARPASCALYHGLLGYSLFFVRRCLAHTGC